MRTHAATRMCAHVRTRMHEHTHTTSRGSPPVSFDPRSSRATNAYSHSTDSTSAIAAAISDAVGAGSSVPYRSVARRPPSAVSCGMRVNAAGKSAATDSYLLDR